MTTDDDYLMLGVPAGVLNADSPPGAAWSAGRGADRHHRRAGPRPRPRRVPAIGDLVPDAGDRPRPRSEIPTMPRPSRPRPLPAATGVEMALAVDADAVPVVEADLLGAPVLVAGRSRRPDRPPSPGSRSWWGAAPPPQVVRDDDPVIATPRVDAWLPACASGRGGDPETGRSCSSTTPTVGRAASDDATRGQSPRSRAWRRRARPGSEAGRVTTDMTQAQQPRRPRWSRAAARRVGAVSSSNRSGPMGPFSE